MKKSLTHFLIVSILFMAFASIAQRGKNGAVTISVANARINEYTTLTANASIGNTTITVASNNLNANGRFASALQVGDLIMIIQMQGASMKTFNGFPQDSTYGEILNYNECGNYEFAQVFALPNATSIVLDCGLNNNYTTVGKTQIIRIPRYSSLTVNAASSITGDTWNGAIGGVVSAEVQGATVINGSVTATGLGFRGGLAANDGNYGGNRIVDLLLGASEGGEKGESIVGSQADYVALYNGKYARGAPANGGGGGNSHNAGGGGGGNGGNVATWFGVGLVNPLYNVAYNLEFPGRAAIVSSGGGRGGYAYSTANLNPNTNRPGLVTWGGDGRRNVGGFGGRPLNYSTGKIYLGGGGGAGHVNNISATNTGGTGGNGGGLVYFVTYGNLSGTGLIITNGNNGVTSTGPNPGFSSNINGIDAAGGGGAGGTIVINTSANVSGITLTANGGLGGNQIIVKGALVTSNTEAEGPGGGGSGGYIALSAGAPTQNVAGANGGTTNSTAMTNFPPNGASNGAPGLSNQSITLYTLTANPVTVCVNNAATLTATSNNATASFFWYNTIAGPTQIATGAVYTTSVFTTPGTYTFFAGMCPGNYRVPVVVTVISGPTLTVNTATVCSGQAATLTANGATTYSWSNGSNNTPSISVSPALTTAYTVTGSLGGCVSFTTTTVTVNASATISASSATICAGQTATLTAGPATSYTWSTGSNTSTTSVSPALTTVYTVTANIGGCSATNTSTVTVNTSPTIAVTSSTICAGQTATLTAGPATTYTWSTGSNTSTASVSPALTTVYTLTANVGGCNAINTSTVTVNALPIVTVNNATICAGGSTTLTAAGATTYTWSTGPNTNSISVSPIVNTNYTVTGTQNGCNSSTVATVNVAAVAAIIVNSSTICSGQTATLIAGPAATYTWSTGPNTNSIVVSPVATTVYTITASVGGCTATNTSTVTVNASPTIAVTSSTICAGQTATLTAGPATSYSWSTGSNTSTTSVSPVLTTVYTLTANIGGCNATNSSTVTVNASPTIAVTSSTICAGQTATLTAGPATTYTWSTASNTSTTSVSPALTTVYTITANIGGCNATNSSTVTVNAIPVTSANNASICVGASATLIASGATTYSWSSGPITNSIVVSPVVNTNYTVTGTQNGCSSSTVVAVTISTIGSIAINTSTICVGQSATLTAAPAASYTWSTGPNTNSIVVSPAVTTTYSLNASVGACPSIGTTTVTVINLPTITVNTPTICNGQSATLTANGATTYSWSTGSILNPIIVSPSVTTTYTVDGTIGTCATSTTATVFVTQNPTVTAGAATICPSQSATLTAAGATSYLWNDGTPTASNVVTPISTTNYTVVGTTGLCSSTATTAVVVSANPVLALTNSTICAGQTTTIIPGGATQYTFDPAGINLVGTSFTLSPALSSTYAVIGSSNTCVSSGTVSVTIGGNLSIAINNATACVGNSIVLTPTSSATSYTWSTGALTNTVSVSPTLTTVYTVTGTSGGCLGTTTVQVSMGTAPTLTINATPICAGQISTLTALGANSYTWLPLAIVSNTISSSPLATTIFTVIGNNGNCDASDLFTLSISPNPTLAINSTSICTGGSGTLTVNGATSYNWLPTNTNGNSLVVSPASTSIYTVVGTLGTCTSQATATVNVVNGFNLTVPNVTICSGESATLTANAGTTFSWSTGATTQSIVVSPLVTTIYKLDGALGSCTSSTLVTVFVNPMPSFTLSNPPSDICAGQSATLNATGALTYTWLPSNLTTSLVTVSPLATTVYTVNSSIGNCTTTRTVEVRVNSYPVLSVPVNTFEICKGTEISIDVTGANNYTISTPKQVTNFPPLVFSPSANTTVTISGANGSCIKTTTAFVIVHVVKADYTSETNYTEFPAYITFTNTSTPTSTISWDFGNGITAGNVQTPRILFEDPRKYLVALVAKDEFGCIDTVMRFIEAGCGSGDIYVPNSFTPNGDGLNDQFSITGTAFCITNFKGKVFNRWGEILFEWKDVDSRWDGTYKGKEVEQNVYIYQLEYFVPGGKRIVKMGHINLIR